MGLFLSQKHGVNPSVEKCFLCREDKGVVLFGRLRGEDLEAPREVTLTREPCDKCKEYMRQGIIFISIDEEKTGEDKDNPWRTGGWVVVSEAYVRRAIDPELAKVICKKRVAFVPDDAWDKMGLPRAN